MGELTPQQQRHKALIHDLLTDINSQGDHQYILKGGTALMACYGLDRFSEDVNLDGRGIAIKNYVDRFAKKRGLDYGVTEDTNTVKRFMLHEGDDLLEVTVSYRNKYIDPATVNQINGIAVYNLDTLAMMKNNAYQSRAKIRDLYDLSFILAHYWDNVRQQTKAAVANAMSYNGLERFYYYVKTQQDALIPKDQVDEMTNNFLSVYDRLGLADDEKQVELAKKSMNQDAFRKAAIQKKLKGMDRG
jgi:predicted nucleotidyltransferase component of viral defense system